jgi:hypothetical protein
LHISVNKTEELVIDSGEQHMSDDSDLVSACDISEDSDHRVVTDTAWNG